MTQLRTATLAVRVQLSLGWNTDLLFNTDIVNFVWKTDEVETESAFLLFFVFLASHESLLGEGVVGWEKSLGAAEIVCFSSQDFSGSNKDFYSQI